MSKDLVSKKTRREFREYLVGWYLAQIRDEFDSADISCDLEYEPPEHGERRSLVEQYYHSVDWTSWADVNKVLRAYENILLDADEAVIEGLVKWLRKDGFVYENDRIRPTSGMHLLTDMKSVAVAYDAEYLRQQVERMERSIESDPSLAIGCAKELIETCCKTILADLGETATKGQDVPQLVKATFKKLNILPEHIPAKSKGVDVIRRILSNLATVASGMAELRNLYGTGHGQHGRTAGLQPRHAKLAVGAATTLTHFLFETFQQTRKTGKNTESQGGG